MLNRAQLKKDQDASKKPKKLRKPKDVIVDPRGQWAHPGEVTRIPSGDITMQGVPYPVLGVDNMGYSQMMQPGGDYQFPGNSVTEYPMANGGQIYDRLGRLHSIKSYVPFAQKGLTYTGAETAADSSAASTYFNRYFNPNTASRAEERLLEIQTAINNKSVDMLQPHIKKQLLIEYNALLDASKQAPMKAKKKQGGSVFPQIQSEDQFFSRAYANIPSPYNGGSFRNGGSWGRPFSTQPKLSEISSYGRPNWPSVIAQDGGVPSWPKAQEYMANFPVPYPMNPDGTTDIYRAPLASRPNTPMPYMYEEDPEIAFPPMSYGTASSKRMGGMMKCSCGGKMGKGGSCMKCGGSKKQSGGAADINQGPEYFTNKMNDFTSNLRNTATNAVMEDMSEMYMKFGGTGYTEEFPYAMPYEYRDGGGIYIKPSKRGTFTAAAKKRGQSVQGFASKVLANKDQYSSAMVKKANFARNAAGWRKQEGGPMQEAKWQAIIALAEQGVTDPIEIASRLNQEGTYPTTPEEVQGYLEQVQGGAEMQDGGQSMNPFAMSNISMYASANQEAQEDANTAQGIGNFLDATANLYRQEGGSGFSQKQFQTWLDEYFTANPDKRPQTSAGSQSYMTPQYQIDPRYGQPAGQGYGYAPANSMPYMKIKNKNYFYGNQGQFPGQSQQQPAPGGNFPAGFATPDGKGKISLNYGRGFLGLGPNRLRSMDYEWGNNPSGLPADSQAYINENPLNRHGKRTTWVGNKLRGLTKNVDKYGTPFPSKRRKEDEAWEEQYAANKANQDSNAFMANKTQAAGDAQFAKDQNMRNSPAWQSQVQDPALIPWLEQTAGRLGTTPDALVNPPVPQTTPAPVETAPEKSYAELDAEYKKSVAERDALFKEHNINKRGRHRNILGIKYGKGGPVIMYGNLQDGGNPYASLAPDLNLGDPSMDPENLPGYVPPPTLNDKQIGEVFGEQGDGQGSVFSKGRIKFGNRMDGESMANWGIAGMNLATNIFSQDERRNAEKNLKKQFKAENIFSSRQDEDRGDYTTNYGYFRPDQQSTGRMVTGKFGGQYQEGGEYEMTDEEIQRLRQGGYTIDYI